MLKHKCPECNGVGYIETGALRPYWCGRCEGSGIRGNPLLGLLFCIVSIALTVLPFILYFWPRH